MNNLLGGLLTIMRRFQDSRMKIAAVTLLIASPWLIVQVGIFVLAPDKEFESIPICADGSGNCAHLGGGDDYRLNEQYPSIINLTADVVYDNLNDYLDDNAWDILIDESTDGTHYVHFVEVTPFWLLPDDVVVSIQDIGDSCIIEIHSESRLGWGDIGVNPARIDDIYQSIT